MPVLKNPRHERFAQLLAAGNSADAAYQEAGYKQSRASASQLHAKAYIKARVAEIIGRAAKRVEITLESMTQMFLEDRTLARELKQISAAVAAGGHIGKLYGLFVDKLEATGKDGGPIVIVTGVPRDDTD